MKKTIFSILFIAFVLTKTCLSDVVINLGARRIICGYVGEDTPNVAFEGTIALPSLDSDEIVVGVDAHEKYQDHTLVYPTSYVHFMGNDIDHLNILVEKCLRDLGNNTGTTVVSSEHRVMITGTLLNNNRNIRQKVAKILFNQFHFTALNIQNSLLLGLQYSGRSTGIIINIEDDATSIAAIYDGSIIHNQELPYGQSTAVKKVAQVLYEDGILGEEILGEQGYKDCYNIYISKCFVISDPKYFTKFKINPIITPFRLSNGQEIELGKVIYQAAEVLVHPEVAGLEEESIANVILKFIRTSPEHMRTFFASNIVLMGHGAKVEGLQERLISELLLYSTRIYDFRIRKSIAYEFGAWPGAQVFASSPIYEQSMIVIEDYNSIGDTLIN